MKKILVLVDFSAPSVNAVAYAADLAGDTGFGEIVLMANCYVPLFEQIVPSPDLVQVGAADIARKQEKTLLQLMALKSEIEKKLPATVLVRVILGSQSLLRSVLEQVAKEEPSVVIIGSNSRAPMEDCSIGRQIIPLAKVMPVPVLVIPPEARYRPIEEAQIGRAPGASEGIKEFLLPLFGEMHYRQYTPKKKDILEDVLETAEQTKAQLIVALPR